MADASRIALILLAAGRSNRFGDEDKLSANLDGLPLGLHAARTLAGIEFLARIAVLGEGAPVPSGFESVINSEPERRMSHSLSLGMAAARAYQPQAVLVALASPSGLGAMVLAACRTRQRNTAKTRRYYLTT